MADEFGTYVDGRGYVTKRKKILSPSTESVERSPMSPAENALRDKAEVLGEGVQQILTRVFNTVPRNKLKESGLD